MAAGWSVCFLLEPWLDDDLDGPCGAEAAASANRRRNYGRKRGLAPDPTGGAAPGGPPPRTL